MADAPNDVVPTMKILIQKLEASAKLLGDMEAIPVSKATLRAALVRMDNDVKDGHYLGDANVALTWDEYLDKSVTRIWEALQAEIQ